MVNEYAEGKQFLALGPQALQPGQHFSCFWKEIGNGLHTWGAFGWRFSVPPGRTGFLVSNLFDFSLKDGFCSETQTKISILGIYAGHVPGRCWEISSSVACKTLVGSREAGWDSVTLA